MECDDPPPLATSEANEAPSEANEAASEAATEATNEEPASQQQMPAAPADSSRTTGGRYVQLALFVAALSTNEERCSLALPLGAAPWRCPLALPLGPAPALPSGFCFPPSDF